MNWGEFRLKTKSVSRARRLAECSSRRCAALQHRQNFSIAFADGEFSSREPRGVSVVDIGASIEENSAHFRAAAASVPFAS
mmetsp:Transcript_80694/g.260793  ORF Transcript_80694/g.260793 Transcript_80694/m.260793 type:complete len:81 (-) Transcript_80694:36-278(-)